MKRIAISVVLLVVALVSAVLVSTPDMPVRAATALTPPTGSWGFCTTDTQVGCIEYFAFEIESGVMREYASLSEAQNVGISPSATCYAQRPSGNAPSCDPSYGYSSTTTCGTAGTYVQLGVGFTPTLNGQLFSGAQFVGRKIVMRARTGDFDPSFAMGGQINSTTRTTRNDGSYLFEVHGQIQTSYGVDVSSVSMSPPDTYRARLSSFLATSVATSKGYGFGATVYPRSWLKSTSVDLNGLCVEVPLVDAWADSNGMGFESSLVPARPTDPVASTIKFKVAGPHYLPESNGNDDKIVPARIRFFVPNTYIAAAGYSDPSQFTEKSLTITAYQGESKTPTLARTSAGILVDFGITHYSTPDPIVTVYKFGSSPSAQTQTPTTTSSTTTSTVFTSQVTTKASALKVGKSMTRNAVLSRAKLTIPKGGSASMKIAASSSKICRLVGTSVRGLKTGTCKVTATVRTKAGKRSAKTVSIAVVK